MCKNLDFTKNIVENKYFKNKSKSILKSIENKFTNNNNHFDKQIIEKLIEFCYIISEFEDFRIELRNSNKIISKLLSEYDVIDDEDINLKLKLGNCLVNLGLEDEILGSSLPKDTRLSDKVINSMPTTNLKILKEEKESNLGFCSICLEEFTSESKIKKLPCGDYFHCECVDIWLKQHNSCPNCRNCLSR